MHCGRQEQNTVSATAGRSPSTRVRVKPSAAQGGLFSSPVPLLFPLLNVGDVVDSAVDGHVVVVPAHVEGAVELYGPLERRGEGRELERTGGTSFCGAYVFAFPSVIFHHTPRDVGKLPQEAALRCHTSGRR